MCTYGPLFGISKIKFKFETSKIEVQRGGIMVFLGFFGFFLSPPKFTLRKIRFS